MTRPRLVRRGAAAALAGAGVLLAASPALAASGASVSAVDLSTGQSVAGQTVTADTTIRVDGSGNNPGTTYHFAVSEPDGTAYASDSQTATFRSSASFQADLPAAAEPNGTWTAKVSGATLHFTLAVPPAAVSGFSASGDANLVTLRWTANEEPDLVGYLVTDPSGQSTLIRPAAAGCSTSASCSTSYSPSAAQQGTTLQFSIKAERNGACGCSSSPVAGAAQTASVAIPASPSPSPSPTGGGGSGGGNGGGNGGGSGGGGGKGSGGTGGTGSGVTRGGSFLTNGNSKHHSAAGRGSGGSGGLQPFSPGKLSLPNLPGFSSTNLGGTLPNAVLPGGEGSAAREQQGGFKPTLAYPAGKGGAKSGTVVAGGRSVTSSFLDVVNQQALWRSLGLAAILLLGGTHLLVWLRRTPAEL